MDEEEEKKGRAATQLMHLWGNRTRRMALNSSSRWFWYEVFVVVRRKFGPSPASTSTPQRVGEPEQQGMPRNEIKIYTSEEKDNQARQARLDTAMYPCSKLPYPEPSVVAMYTAGGVRAL